MVISPNDVSRALSNREFVPHFQPLVRLRTRQLYGFEMLARWSHPELGSIPPDHFILLAERDGWIHSLTEQLLQQGFEAVASLPGDPTLSVNISPLQLHDSTVCAQIQAAAASTGFSLRRLVVEITESALAEDVPAVRRTVQSLKEAGCRLALDDFGTGYSSLRHLQSLPFDELKVDRTFVSSMTLRRESRKIVAALVGLGQSLDLTTVAEGVETAEQADMLLWLGCELGQGWLFGKPAPAAALPEICRQLEQPVAGLTSSFVGRRSAGSLENFPAQRLSQLQAVYDGAPVGLAFVDRNLRYRTINRRLAAMNGRPMEEHLGRTVAEMIPDFFHAVEPYIRRALAGEAVPGVELTRPTPGSGEPKTVLLSYEPAFDEAGEVEGVSVALVDLTPIKRAEQAQRESEEHFRHMIELIPSIPWVIDPEGRALDVSQRWLDLTGMTGDQWRGFGWLDALHPEDVQPTLDAMEVAFTTQQPIDVHYRVRKSEDHPWRRLRSRGAPRLGDDGTIVCWYGVLEDAPDEHPASEAEEAAGPEPVQT